MAGSPSQGRRTRRGRALARSALLLGALALLASALPGALATTARWTASGSDGTAGACPGSPVAGPWEGSLSVEKSGAPRPTVADVAVTLSYTYERNFTPKSGPSEWSCYTGRANATTTASGGFVFSDLLPASSCTPYGCSSYSGPFSPSASLTNGPAPGFFVLPPSERTNLSIVEVAALDRVTAAAAASVVSPYAPDTVSARALAGNGGPSPATLTLSWATVTGGWSVIAGASTSVATVEATDAPSNGSFSVTVDGSYAGAELPAVSANVTLRSIPTEVGSTDATPLTLDAGGSVTLALSGSGAPGYNYTATFTPGLGLADLAERCRATGASGEAATLACSASVTYAAAGVAHPTVRLSNGYASATAALPDVTVANTLALGVAPSFVRTYAGRSVDVNVTVAPGTGTAPFGPACLSTAGRTTCESAGTGRWSFLLSYDDPGNYSAVATARDAAGENASAGGAILVAALPTLGAIVPANATGAVGVPLRLTSALGGGFGPFVYWWNLSGASSATVSGVAAVPGTIGTTWVPLAEGAVTARLTVLDALGTRVTVSAAIAVGPGGASSLALAVRPSNGTAVAGGPFVLSGRALDAAGALVPDFALSVALEITQVGNPSGEGLFLNGTVPAAWTAEGNGSFVAGADAWAGGYLNGTLVALRAGSLSVALVPPTPTDVSFGKALGLEVLPDLAHLVLASPDVVVAGARLNATRYAITDEYGNPAFGTYVVVRSIFGAVTTSVDAPVLAGANGSAYVWVNYSAPTAGNGTVMIESPSGVALLPALQIPAAPPAPVAASPGDGWAEALSLALAGLAAAVGALYLRYRRRTAVAPGVDASDAELRRFADGTHRILERLARDGALTREALGTFDDDDFVPPTAAELDDWLGGLLAEGRIGREVGPSGEERFWVVPPSEGEEAASVELDETALDRALRARAEEEEREEGGPGVDERYL